MIELRTRDEIEAMRPAGRFVAAVLMELAERTRVGIGGGQQSGTGPFALMEQPA